MRIASRWKTMLAANRVGSLPFLMMTCLLWASAMPPVVHAEAAAIDDVVTKVRAERIRKLSDYIADHFGVSERKARAIVTEAMRHGARHELHPELILAIIAVESTFKERAVSPRGARGLMQILPQAHPKKIKAIGGVQALFDPSKNISTGVRILNDYMALSDGDLRRALLRYNGSLGNPKSRYPSKVLKHYNKFRQATGTEVALN